MARVIPVIARQALEQSSSKDAVLVFVTITHPEMVDIIRLVIDGVDYLIDDVTWHRSFFELDLLTDEDTPPQARFRFPNVNRVAINMLSRVATPARVQFDLISSAYFDLTADPRTVLPGMTPELIYSAKALFLVDITADEVQVEGTLRSWDIRVESWPDKRATEALTPGAFMR